MPLLNSIEIQLLLIIILFLKDGAGEHCSALVLDGDVVMDIPCSGYGEPAICQLSKILANLIRAMIAILYFH